MKERARTIGKWAIFYALGGRWSPPFKRQIIYLSAITLSLLGTLAWVATGDINFYPVLPIYGMVVALIFSLWLAVLPVPPDYKPCEGPRNVYGSPSGEMQLGICHGCEGWAITIRGCEVGMGRGKDELVKRLSELQNQWAKDVPYIAAEIQECREGIEEEDDLTKDLMPGVESGSEEGQMAEALNSVIGGMSEMSEEERRNIDPAAVIKALQDSMGDKGMAAVMVPADEYSEFAAWRKANGQPVDVNAPVVTVARPVGQEADPRADADLKDQAQRIADDMNGEGNGNR